MNKSIEVIILIYPNLCLFEFACALEVFAQKRPEFEQTHYRTRVLNLGANFNLDSLSLEVKVLTNLSVLNNADLIVIPGWQGTTIRPDAKLVKQLNSAYKKGARIASICSGAFLLGYSGLLNGRKATTHWRYYNQAKILFPEAEFDETVLYTDDKRILSSAGSAAGLDMCLHIVRSDYGHSVANSYARRLVIPPFRDGGQAQFIQNIVPESSGNSFAKLTQTIEKNLHKPFSIETMAEIVHMSERHFQRRFKEHFSTTPNKWLTKLRLQKVCEFLETTNFRLKTIADACGFGSEESLRRHFRIHMKVSPMEYRATFTGEA